MTQCSRLVGVTLYCPRKKFTPSDAAFCQNSLTTYHYLQTICYYAYKKN